MTTISAEGFEAENPWEEWTLSGDGGQRPASRAHRQGSLRAGPCPDARIAGYAAGRQLRTGIVMGCQNEAELDVERKRLEVE